MTNRLPIVSAAGLDQQLQLGDLVAPGALVGITNSDAVTQYAGMVVRSSAAGACLLAQADTEAHSTNVLGARLADVVAAGSGTVGVFQPGLRVRLAGAASRGDRIYLSAITPGVGDVVVPALPGLPVLLGYCDASSEVGGVWYADLVPYQPQPVVGFSSMRWTPAYSNDFTLLTNQNLMTGGDGVKTLSDGSHVYVGGTARASAISIVNGSGLRISALGTGTASATTAASAYWRMEDLGNVALNRREWTMLRCCMIASSVRPVTGSVGPCDFSGFYGSPSGNIPADGIPTWNFGSTWLCCHTRNWYTGGVTYEGAPYMGSGGGALVRGANGMVLAEGVTPKDLIVVVFTRAEILVWLSSSVGSDFPSDVLANAILIGTYRSADIGSYDVTAVLASAWEVTGGGGQTVYVKKLRCEYK